MNVHVWMEWGDQSTWRKTNVETRRKCKLRTGNPWIQNPRSSRCAETLLTTKALRCPFLIYNSFKNGARETFKSLAGHTADNLTWTYDFTGSHSKRSIYEQINPYIWPITWKALSWVLFQVYRLSALELYWLLAFRSTSSVRTWKLFTSFLSLSVKKKKRYITLNNTKR